MVPYILIVMIVAIALTIFAERRQIQAPLLLAAVGIAASFIPGISHVEVHSSVLLGVVLPPLLYSAALHFSFFSFMRRLSSILNLGVALVLVTAFASAFVMVWLFPDMPFAVALLLGAVIAPPDAVSAVAIGSQLHLPSRVMTILKGESLINDAAALTLFTAAATVATGGRRFISNPAVYFLYSAGAGVAIGIVLGLVTHEIRRRLTNPTMITALALMLPFTAYVVAEEAHASGVLAVVFSGFVIGHKATDMNFAGRLQEHDVWRVIDALLEAFVFAYIGLQFRHIVDVALEEGFTLVSLGQASGILIVTVILVRLVWIFLSNGLANRTYQTEHEKRRRKQNRRAMPEPLSWRENLIISWAGMRGVVTLAAAAGVPTVTVTGGIVSGWGAVLPVAFSVAIGTLLLQGLTLPMLIRKLGVTNAGDARYYRDQMSHAREVANRARLAALDELMKDGKARVNAKIAERMLKQAQRESQEDDPALPQGTNERHRKRIAQIADITRYVLVAQRSAIIAERNAQRLDDDVMRKLLVDMDLEQAFIARRAERAAQGL